MFVNVLSTCIIINSLKVLEFDLKNEASELNWFITSQKPHVVVLRTRNQQMFDFFSPSLKDN